MVTFSHFDASSHANLPEFIRMLAKDFFLNIFLLTTNCPYLSRKSSLAVLSPEVLINTWRSVTPLPYIERPRLIN